MIFGPDELLELIEHHAAKLGVPVPVDHGTMRAVAAEAERLAGSHTDDEPAALFYLDGPPDPQIHDPLVVISVMQRKSAAVLLRWAP